MPNGIGVRLRGAGGNKPTPWLRRVYEQMLEDGFNPRRKWVLDLGAGNGRNSEWLWRRGLKTIACDPAPAGSNVYEWNGRGFPAVARAHSYDIILMQYVLMFVPAANINTLAYVVDRAARFGCVLVLEAYDTKTGHYQRQMLHDFVQKLDVHTLCGRWVQRMADGNDHLAFQLVAGRRNV